MLLWFYSSILLFGSVKILSGFVDSESPILSVLIGVPESIRRFSLVLVVNRCKDSEEDSLRVLNWRLCNFEEFVVEIVAGRFFHSLVLPNLLVLLLWVVHLFSTSAIMPRTRSSSSSSSTPQFVQCSFSVSPTSPQALSVPVSQGGKVHFPFKNYDGCCDSVGGEVMLKVQYIDICLIGIFPLKKAKIPASKGYVIM